MTKTEKDLAWLLLQEKHYLVRSVNANGKEVYKIMKDKQVPVQYFTKYIVQKFGHVLKGDAKHRMVIDIRAVQQLNGNNYMKRLYKQCLILKKRDKKIPQTKKA